MSFREQLELVVNATTAGGEAGLARLTGAAERTATAAKDAGTSVERAAQRAAEARLKEADAAGTVRVAEQRLKDLRDKGNATQAQLVAAEEKLEAARRRQHTATREVEGAVEAAAAAERDAAEASTELADSSGEAGLSLDDLKEKAAKLAAGLAIGDWARDAFGGFTEGARAASNLARSMNATIGEGGQLATIFSTLGLESGDLLEIQAEFANVIGANAGALSEMGAEVKRNSDGTINYAATIEDTLAQLQQIPDATERNRRGFQLFGEEGYKQLAALTNSSTDVRDAFDRVGQPFTQADVDAVAEFDSMMLDLDLTSGELGRTLGRFLLPVITGLAEGAGDVADLIGEIPTPMLLGAGAAVALGFGMRSAATEGTFLATSLARANAMLAVYRAQAATAGASSALLTAGMAGARGAASGLMGALGGPIGLGLIAGATVFSLMSDGAEELDKNAREAAVGIDRVGGAIRRTDKDVQAAARELVDNAGAFERANAAGRGYAQTLNDNGIPQWLTDADVMGRGLTTLAGLFGEEELATAGAAKAIEDQAGQLEGLEEQQAETQLATKGLNDLIAEGTTHGQAFADAVREAAEAQAAESYTTDVAEASIAAYNATTRDAIDTMLELYQAQLGQRSGWQDVLTALQDTANATEDGETAASEVEQAYIDLIGTVLDYAGASGDAAVEAARAAGTVLDPLTEAQIRTDATMKALQESLNAPNLTERARAEIQAMIDQLATAKDEGNIEAMLTLTGAEETASTLDKTTEDREAVVEVETRGGPAADKYLDGLAGAQRLSIVRVESRGGPAVVTYLQTIVDAQRLALIRVESRGGPDVDRYLDGLASQDRLAIIRVETRGGPAVQRYLDDLAGAARVAGIDLGSGLRGGPGAGSYAAGAGVALRTVELDLKLTGSIDRRQATSAERGRAIVQDVRAYEQRNGTGWRKG